MPNRHSVRFLLFLFLLMAGLVLVGCSDDEEVATVVDGTGSVGGDGDIFVNTDPSMLDVPWTLSLPGGETVAGENDERLKNQNPGHYALSWPKLNGWNEPRPSIDEQTLEGGSNLAFNAIYLPQPGTALVKVAPDGLGASWSLSDDDVWSFSSSGDTTFTNLTPGTYFVTWDDVEGFETPEPTTASLNAVSPLLLVGNYTYPDSTMLINPVPTDADASWIFTGPDGLSINGTGQTKIDIAFDGEYTITWLDLDNYQTPDPETVFITLEDGKLFSLSGVYESDTGSVSLIATINGTDMPWYLTNAAGGIQHGEGDAVLTGMRPGTCSVEWLALDGWSPGAGQELELGVGGSIAFTAAPAAAVTVRPTPEDLFAPWQLSGPGGYTYDGSGEELVEGLADGSYTITWTGTPGWGGPAASTQSLSADSGIVFEGHYAQIAQTLHVNPLPASLDIAWEISGPAGFSEAGSGMASFSLVETGQYTVTWATEAGYMQPGPMTLDYSGEGNLNFVADYQNTLDLVAITVSAFEMGSPRTEGCRTGYELEHDVTLTNDFIMKTTEVTNAEYIAMAQWALDRGYVTANNYGVNDNLDGSTVELLDLDDGDQEIFFENGLFRCIRPDHPVKEVSWYGAVAYCDWLSLYRGMERSYNHNTWECGSTDPSLAPGFRLPTETEWEFACGAGSIQAYANDVRIRFVSDGVCTAVGLPALGWHDINSEGWSHDVGLLDSNAFGLYDMHGNVMEWCNDWNDDQYYRYILVFGPLTDPPGPLFGEERIARGGYFFSPVEDCRTAARAALHPSNASYDTGFRVVLTGN